MRIFVTGATGFVGSAVVRELLDTGHEVLGLARSETATDSLRAIGARAHRGDLDDFDSLRGGVALSDAVIHTAFNHDFSQFQANCETDRRVINALGGALAGSDRPLIVTSAIGILPVGERVSEETMPAYGSNAHPRAASEEAADAAARTGVNVSVVRLPPSVHGEGDHAFVPTLIRIARDKGASAYIGEGLNRWPAVHRLDAARVYRLVLEKGTEPGTRYHAVAEEGIPFRDIATVIGNGLDVPVIAKTPEEGAGHFGWFAHFAAMDIEASSARTKKQLDWQPNMPSLIKDLDGPHYFRR